MPRKGYAILIILILTSILSIAHAYAYDRKGVDYRFDPVELIGRIRVKDYRIFSIFSSTSIEIDNIFFKWLTLNKDNMNMGRFNFFTFFLKLGGYNFEK